MHIIGPPETWNRDKISGDQHNFAHLQIETRKNCV